MHIQQSRGFLGLVIILFCTVAFSSAGADQTGGPSGFEMTVSSESVTPHLLLAKNETNTVCVALPGGNFVTKNLTDEQLQKLREDHPQEYVLGPCENEKSPD